MAPTWDYRYELTNFVRHGDGSYSYTCRSEGNIPWRENLESTILMLNAWETARLAAEKTGKDAIVYVIGKRIVCRTRTRIDNAA